MKGSISLRKIGKKYNPQKRTQIICADFYQWCNDNLKNNSIDLILTKPPNTKNDLSLWEKFTEQAARVLKPSRFLIAFCNQRYLDKVFHILSNHLNYHWMYCIGLNGIGNGKEQMVLLKNGNLFWYMSRIHKRIMKF